MLRFTRQLSLALILATALVLVSSRNGSSQTVERDTAGTLTLGLVSEIDQKPIEEHFRGFVDYVARKFSQSPSWHGAVMVAPSGVELAQLLARGKVDFYFESPYPTYVINHVQDAGKLLLRRWKSGKAEYRSLIFSRSAGGIARLQDLRGKTIVFEDAESTSGYFLPKFFLQRNGFKLADRTRAPAGAGEVGYIFAKSPAQLIEMVRSGKAAAGAFSDDDYAALDAKSKAALTILAQTELLPRHLVSVRKDLPPRLVERLGSVLLSMHEDAEGRVILRDADQTTRFDPLPGGEEAMRRRLLDTFYAPDRR